MIFVCFGRRNCFLYFFPEKFGWDVAFLRCVARTLGNVSAVRDMVEIAVTGTLKAIIIIAFGVTITVSIIESHWPKCSGVPQPGGDTLVVNAVSILHVSASKKISLPKTFSRKHIKWKHFSKSWLFWWAGECSDQGAAVTETVCDPVREQMNHAATKINQQKLKANNKGSRQKK